MADPVVTAAEEVVREAFAAWAAGTGTVFDALADDVTWTITGTGRLAGTYTSRQELIDRAIAPIGRPWGAELTIDLAERPHLLKLARESGCRDLFLGIESVSQMAIDGLDKWSNDTNSIGEMVRRVHDAGNTLSR